MDDFGDEDTARAQCKALGIDYENERPKLSNRANELFNIFALLNRRRVDHRPLQKNDILGEIDHMDYQDKALESIEALDSFWLSEQAKKINRKLGK